MLPPTSSIIAAAALQPWLMGVRALMLEERARSRTGELHRLGDWMMARDEWSHECEGKRAGSGVLGDP